MDKVLQVKLDDLANKGNRSRNELVNIALDYIHNKVKFVNGTKKDS
jgi:hypothetical protein